MGFCGLWSAKEAISADELEHLNKLAYVSQNTVCRELNEGGQVAI